MQIVLRCLVLCFLFFGCKNNTTDETAGSHPARIFHLLDAKTTGIDFINEVVDEDSFNILTYRNFYNGGGVAIGDINNDSLPDLYYTSNQKKNKLYLNKGNFKFKSETATPNPKAISLL